MRITAQTNICMVIGDPIGHSLSPQLHNAGYEALGIDDRFVYVAANVKIELLKPFIEGVKIMGIRGVSCTMPHKLEVMQYLDELNETAQKIGAVNTIVNENGKLIGYNTDWLGVITPLEQRSDLVDKHVVVIGAGGAARAIVYGLVKKGAKVTIMNRTLEKAQELAKEFSCDAASLDQEELIENADIIMNATSVGMKPNEENTPVSAELFHRGQIVFDAIYNPVRTKLLSDAKKQGAIVISGLEMLLYQGTAQFELYTGEKAPTDVMKKILFEKMQ